MPRTDRAPKLARPWVERAGSTVNFQDAEFIADLKEWAETDGIPKRWRGLPQPMNPGEKQADDHFQVAVALLKEEKSKRRWRG